MCTRDYSPHRPIVVNSTSSDSLSEATGANGPSLYRLLRTLASMEVFSEDQNAHFARISLGASLRRGVPNSVWDRAIYDGAPEMWKVWGNLLHSVKTGESACEHVPFMIICHSMSTEDNRKS
jgi:hypothetical protein